MKTHVHLIRITQEEEPYLGPQLVVTVYRDKNFQRQRTYRPWGSWALNALDKLIQHSRPYITANNDDGIEIRIYRPTGD